MKSLLFALHHLTRLPLPSLKFDEISCGRSTAFFPFAGFILGGILALFAIAIRWVFPAPAQASLLVVGMVVLTGGIHLDGFMDSVDGLFSGRPRERKLEIMRDSRTGAFGVIGVTCLLLLKYSVFLGISGQNLIKTLLVVPALSRWGMSIAVVAFPYARPEGLGKIYALYTGNKELAWATVFAAVIAVVILGVPGIFLMFLAGAVTCLVGKAITKELGGLTGDTYGFINELLEVLLLLAVLSIIYIEPSMITNWF
ncbi:MAG: adenosylcobinamide-GDP ribazoletransferase [Desulfotomaculaceae bacterium]|nr:adenosylcobinamide-GDP ribazoletransferase [Desulfotomaculaceae bacterium]